MVNCLTHVIVLIVFIVVTFFTGQLSAAETGYKLAQELRDNVVKVIGVNSGFGFIVGEDEKGVYIVSAYHVLCSLWPCEDNVKTEVTVCFFRNKKKCYKSELLLKGSSKKDFVVLRASLPPGQHWKKQVLGSVDDLKDQRDVWYVGRKGEWFIPSSPGAFNHMDMDSNEKLLVTDLKIKGGTSGAPLLSKHGIVGMLLTAKGSDEPRALSIDFIKEIFHTHGFPWGLQKDPYADPLMAKAKRYYDFKLYKDAFEAYQKAADKGNTRAMTSLGLMHLHGEGTKKNTDEAVSWFKKAVRVGDSVAMGLMGMVYQTGWGVTKDQGKALWWYTKAAEKNEPEAIYMLALAYEHGHLGVVKNFNRAVGFYHRACKAGSIPAKRRLADLGESCE